jgi:hypothetical protein
MTMTPEQFENQRDKLVQSIRNATVSVDFPPEHPLTFAFFSQVILRQQKAIGKPWLSAEHREFDLQPLLEAITGWTDRDKWSFINHRCDSVPTFVYTKLLDLIDSTETLGQSAVVSLIVKEIELAQMLNVPPSADRVAKWINTYTGRIDLLPDITRSIKSVFVRSDGIDQALASKVPAYIAGRTSFNAVARDSDFFMVVEYPQTFKAYLEHFAKTTVDVDAISLFFRDQYLSSRSVPLQYVEVYEAVLGEEMVTELFAQNLVHSDQHSGDGPQKAFALAFERYGEPRMLATPQFQAMLLEAQDKLPGLMTWIFSQSSRLSEMAPELHAQCIQRLPEIMSRHRLNPSGSIMEVGVKLMGGETFIRHYLTSLREALKQDVTSQRDWRLFRQDLRNAGYDDISTMTDLQLIDYSYAVSPVAAPMLATQIKNVCYFAGLTEMAKVASNLGSQAAEGLLRGSPIDQHQLIVELFPQARAARLETELGL